MQDLLHQFPLSAAQRRLWVLDQLAPGSPQYNLCQTVRLDFPVVEALLQKSIDTVVARHDALRTSIQVAQDDEPFQIVTEPSERALRSEIALRIVRASGDNDDVIQATLTDEIRQPFDLSAGPLLRITLIRIGPQSNVLVIVMHHIISDGESVTVFLRELETCYQAYASNRTPVLPELPIQYPDYAVWQQEAFSSAALSKQLGFWADALDGVTNLELPTDRPRPATPSFRGDQVSFDLDERTTAALSEIALKSRATLFMTLLAGFAVVLARYSGQADVAIGTPISRRDHVELENLIGFFVNSLVLRVNLSGDPTFEELVGRVRDFSLAAYAHQDVPFELLVDKLRPPRDGSRNPLFQVLFQLQHSPASHVEETGHFIAAPRVQNSPFDMAVSCWKAPNGIHGSIQFATDLFDRATIERFQDHLRNLWASAAKRPGERISKLSILSAEERRTILQRWNETEVPGKPLFIEQSLEGHDPAAVAIRAPDGQMTYGELWRFVSAAALRLRRQGVTGDVKVAVLAERSAHSVAAALAIMRAGGVYVPLDPQYPQERLNYMVQDSGARIVLTSLASRGRINANNIHEIPIEMLSSDEPGDTASLEYPENSAAYLIYTSGSTGTPKGVVVERRGLANVLEAQRSMFQLNSSTRVLQLASPCFDASIFEWALAFGSGGRLCIPPAEAYTPSEDLLAFIESEAANTVVSTPSVLAALEPERCASLKLVLFAGDACPAETASAWLPGRRVFNLYGPTESTIWATAAEITPESAKPSIGRPIANTRTYILDRSGSPCPVGVPGELHIAGVGVAREYLNRPDLTAGSFLGNPFTDEPAYRRMYKTGDVCRYMPDGQIDFLGRNDSQRKLRGFRVELGEVETCLSALPGVKQCCAAIAGDGPSAVLMAFIVPDGAQTEADKTIQRLRLDLRRYLPAHLIPSKIVAVESIPLTSNGKTDRQSLVRLHQQAAPRGATIAPTNALEASICEAFSTSLGCGAVGPTDNFFELGGNSLLAIRTQKALESRLRRRVRIASLFQYPTAALLAEHLEQDHLAPVFEPGRMTLSPPA